MEEKDEEVEDHQHHADHTPVKLIRQVLLNGEVGAFGHKIEAYQQEYLGPPPLATMKSWGRTEMKTWWVLKQNHLDDDTGIKSFPPPDSKPSWVRKEWSLWRKEIEKIRSGLPLVSSQKGDGRSTSGNRRQKGLSAIFRHPGWVSADLGFFRLRGKNYGQFFIAVQTLSGKIFVTKIANKKWISLKKAMEQMFQEKGFEQTIR